MSLIENNEDVRYLALLRGINVGGNNIVKMTDLRNWFEEIGLNRVSTYIQSGNVLFETRLRSAVNVASVVEPMLQQKLGKPVQAVVVSREQLQTIVLKAPSGFGSQPDKYRCDVIFIKPPIRASEILPAVSLKEGVDEVFEKSGVLYTMRLISRASESRLSKLVNHPAYKSMTVRNWAPSCVN